MTVVRASGDDRASALARRLADRGLQSGLLTAEAAQLLQEAFGSDSQTMRDALEEAFAAAVEQGVLRVEASHAEQAIALVASAASDDPPPVADDPAAAAVALARPVSAEPPVLEARFIETWLVDARIPATVSPNALIPPAVQVAAPLSYARPRPAEAAGVGRPAIPAAESVLSFARAKSAANGRASLEAAGPRLPASEDLTEYRPRPSHMAAAALIAVLLGGTPFLMRAWEDRAAPITVETTRPASAPADLQPRNSVVAMVTRPADPVEPLAQAAVQPPPSADPFSATSEPPEHAPVAGTSGDASEQASASIEPEAPTTKTQGISMPWAGLPVAIPPRVVVEYPNGEPQSQEKAMRVAAALRDKGVTVVGISASRAHEGASVTYGFVEDRGAAETLASLLGSPWQAREQTPRADDRKLPEPGTVRLSLQ